MDIDGENLTNSLEVSSFVMIAPSSILVVVQLNNVKDNSYLSHLLQTN
jgi:hypothetical protein